MQHCVQEVDSLYLSIFELQISISGIEDQIALSKQVYDAVSRDFGRPNYLIQAGLVAQYCANAKLFLLCCTLMLNYLYCTDYLCHTN